MSKRLKDLIAKKDELVARAQAISDLAADENRELSDEETKETDEVLASVDKLTKDIDRESKIVAATKERLANAARAVSEQEEKRREPSAKFTVPASAIRGKLSAFKGENAERDAYASGQWLAATFFGNEKAKEWCNSHGVNIRAAHSTSDNAKGGFTVPEVMESSIIRLVQDYGVFRRNVGSVWPMPNGSTRVTKRNGGFTSYYVGENNAITASDMAFAQVQLTAKKLGVLTQISSELLEDSALQLADLVSTEFAYAFALAEDKAGFLGDGTGTYGGIVGLANALAAGSLATTASNVDTYAELTIATVHEAMGKIANYPGMSKKWYMTQSCFAQAFERLALAAGGNNTATYAAGMGPTFLGYPVEITNALSDVADVADPSGVIFAYFGDLSMAAEMGDARGITLASSTDKYFSEDAIALRATERYDINIHDVGTATAAGSIVGLKFNAA